MRVYFVCSPDAWSRISTPNKRPLVGLRGGRGPQEVNRYAFVMAYQNLKRPRVGSAPCDSGSEKEAPEVFDAFIVIESLDKSKSFNNVSPFLIQKTIQSKFGNSIKNTKKLRDGKLLVEVTTKKQSLNVQKMEFLCDIQVRCYPHRSLNTSKGIIRDRRLFCCPEDEIRDELSSEGVTHVRRLTFKKGDEVKKTNSYVLTFNTPKRPLKINILSELIPVSPYIPNPLRCFACQKFGHHEDSCRNTPVCGKCAGFGGHHAPSCTHPAKCANCNGAHPSWANSCPVWLKEKEITRVKVTNNLSYPEARKLVEDIPTKTYSSIVRSGTKSVTLVDAQTQTTDASTQTPASLPTDSTKSSQPASGSVPPTVPQHKPGTPGPEDGKNKNNVGKQKVSASAVGQQKASASQRGNQTPASGTKASDAKQKPSANKTTSQPFTDVRNKRKGRDRRGNQFNNLRGLPEDQMEIQDESSDEPRSRSPSNTRSRSPVLPP